MPVVITTTGTAPTVGASFDSWGGIINLNIASVKADLDALATQVNIDSPLAAAALPKTGGTMTGDVTLADVAPNGPLSVGFRGVPSISIDSDRTFLNTDSGKCIRLTGTTSRIWTIPANTLAVGAAIMIRSVSSAVLTVARGPGTALRIDGSSVSSNITLSPFGRAVLYHEAPNDWTVSGTGVS